MKEKEANLKTQLTGPSLPRALASHEMVSLGNRLITMGGYNYGEEFGGFQNIMFQFECSNLNCQWKQMAQTLDYARRDFVAMLIPNELTDC